MALEAVVFHDLLSCNVKDMYSPWEITGLVDEDKTLPFYNEWKPSCSSLTGHGTTKKEDKAPLTISESNGRKKRRRTKGLTNKEEAENQRITHIAVERNRRKLMNDYLAVLRSLMPASYAHRGDQASIVGGAINYVKELQQIVQFLQVRKQGDSRVQDLKPLASFFSFPQYSLTDTAAAAAGGVDRVPANPSAVEDIEVTIVESHCSLKIVCRRRPKQLLKLVVGLQSLRLSTLHLNATTFGAMVLFTFSLKVEEDCQIATVDEIATAVHQIVVRIHEEEGFCTSS